MSSTQSQAQPLNEYILTTDQTRYIVRKHELKDFLAQIFGDGIDFNVSTKSHRWKYWAPRGLTADEIKLLMKHLCS